MNSLWKAIGFGGPAVPNFNFDLGSAAGSSVTPGVTWTLRSGSRLDDKAEVTIFEAKITPSNAEIARSFLKRAKTLMLPGFLRCFDAAEHNETAYMACEPCTPLSDILGQRDIFYEDEEKFINAAALGLHSIANGLVALHRNKMLYNNINVQSVYVTKSGEWRLFGHEFVCGFDEEHSLYKRSLALVPEHRVPPEVASRASGGASGPAEAADAWGIACLIFEAFANRPSGGGIKSQDMKTSRVMPKGLQPLFVGLTGSNPKLRTPLDKMMSDSFFTESEYVTSMMTLQELSLKDTVERDAFYRNLAAHVDNFPLRACKYIILEKLNIAVQFGSGSASALEPLLKIGARLDEHEFAQLVAPVVVSLFSSPDHLVRCRLLSTASQYARLLPSALVCDKIWPQFVTGFANKNADLRELTVRALVHFAPLLNEKIITTDVLKGITLLQQDREGPIRTNATICLGLIATTLPPSLRSKTLVNGFGRMLKDPFTPSKVAALRCIGSSQEHLAVADIAAQLLPAVSPAAVDVSSEVRDVALKTMKALLTRLEQAHGELPKDEPAAPAASAATPTGATSSDDGHNRSSSDVGASYVASTAAAPPPPSGPARKPSGGGGGTMWSWGSSSSLTSGVAAEEPPAVQASPVVVPAMKPSASVVQAKKKEEDDDWQTFVDPVPTDAPSTSTPARPGALKLGSGAVKKKGLGATKAE